jgi:hypothetical protein
MIDSPDLCGRYLTGVSSLLELRTDLGQYIKITKVSQPLGTFVFQLQPAGTKINLVVQNPGTAPIASIPLSKKIEFVFPALDNWRVVDPKGKTWTLQFRDPNDARRVIAALALIMAVTDPDKPATFDPPGAEPSGKSVSTGDTVKVAFHEFAIDSFPIVGRLAGTQTAANGTITPTRNPIRFFDQLAGMHCGSTRVVYLPSSPDSGTPAVYVVDLLRAKYRSSDVGVEPEPEVPEPSPVSAPISSSPPQSEVSDQPAEDDTSQKKSDVMSRLLKMGAQGGPMATLPPKPTPAKIETEPPAASESPVKPPGPSESSAKPPASSESSAPRSVAASIAASENRRIEERLEAVERSLEAQLELLVQPRAGSDVDSVIAGITALNVQLRTKQSNRDQFQHTLDEVRAKNAQNPIAREADAVRLELDEQKRKAGLLAAKAKEQAAQLAELERALSERQELAKSRATQVVRGLMGTVFEVADGRFEEDGRFTGAEIGRVLFDALKEEAGGVLARLNREGLI